MTIASMDGYRRTLLNDLDKKVKIKEMEAIQSSWDKLNQQEQLIIQKQMELETDRIKNSSILSEHNDTLKSVNHNLDRYKENPSEYNKSELNKSIEKLDECINKLNNMTKESITFIGEFYDKYLEFLSELGPDKIVCVFNIVTGSITLSSFLTVLSIMLSENIINKIEFLNNYPRILKLLKLRNSINKKFIKFHLTMHFLFISATILGNIYMFFL